MLLAIAFSAAGVASCARRAETLRTRVMVTGEADVRARPDTALVTLTVVTQSPRAVEAQQANARKTEAVISAVKGVAGAGVEIATSDYSLNPQYDYGGDGPPRIGSYEARNSVTVTTGQLDNVGAVIDAATGAGANSVDGVRFILRESNAAHRETLGAATRQAMEKAEAMAQALGGRIIRVVEEQEGGFINRPTLIEPTETSAATSMNANMNSGHFNRQSRTPVETGQLNVRSQVQLIVEIETPH
jgi:uncharacterized protein YggE